MDVEEQQGKLFVRRQETFDLLPGAGLENAEALELEVDAAKHAHRSVVVRDEDGREVLGDHRPRV